MAKYTFKTIVAPEAVRAEFTALRDQLNSSDKELMQAFWNIGVNRLDDLKKEVEMLQASSAQARAEKRELKLAAKKAQAETKKAAKKTTKKSSNKKVEEKVSKIEVDDDIECVVVDATR